MKILFLGAFGKGALENYYLKGLRREQSDISTYEIAGQYYDTINKSLVNKALNKINPGLFFESINETLKIFLRDKQYDVIIVFKGLALFPQTIEELKSHSKLLCCYNPDHPFKFFSPGSGNSNILNSIKFYDIYITYSERIRSDLEKQYGVNAFTIPFGFDDTSEVEAVSPTTISDKWLLIGSYDRERATFISKLNEKNVAIYGDDKWRTRNRINQTIREAFQGRSLFDEEYKNAVRTAMGVFNLLRKQNIEEGSHNMRSFEVPGYGGLMIANRTEEQQLFFEEGKEAVFFDSIDELRDKLRYLYKNTKQIESMKMAAWERSRRSNYGYTDRSRALYNLWKNHLS